MVSSPDPDVYWVSKPGRAYGDVLWSSEEAICRPCQNAPNPKRAIVPLQTVTNAHWTILLLFQASVLARSDRHFSKTDLDGLWLSAGPDRPRALPRTEECVGNALDTPTHNTWRLVATEPRTRLSEPQPGAKLEGSQARPLSKVDMLQYSTGRWSVSLQRLAPGRSPCDQCCCTCRHSACLIDRRRRHQRAWNLMRPRSPAQHRTSIAHWSRLLPWTG